MLARLTWTPDNGIPETLTVDLPAARITEMRGLIGTPEWATSEAVMWMPAATDDGPLAQRLFRLRRITAIEPQVVT